ncbi:MAG: SufD family Fe-S cluster assembly protein, partial [Alphaproteobacteria bacterium]|nr:SufD family Fe-S cluster assembly protein [Alphaproteobacteria bacterium]
MRPEPSGFLDNHAAFVEESPAPGWIADLRARGAARFAAAGLPDAGLETWRYTNLLPATSPYAGAPLSQADVAYTDPHGLIRPFASVYAEGAPDWLQALQAEEKDQENALWALCNAYLRDGLMIDVPAGKAFDAPIHITLTGHDGAFFVPRTAFRLQKGSVLTIIEHHTGRGAYWNNRLTQIIVEEGARLRHIRFQKNTKSAVYTQNTDVRVAAGGRYEAFNFVVGAALSRQELRVDLAGPRGRASLTALHLLGENQCADQTITVAHNAPDGVSDQDIRSIIAGRARSVFQGKAYVERGADGTDARQMSKALLLADGAEMDAKPELEIY